MTGKFITFEGGEGCGKSSQAKLLSKKLAGASIPAVLTHEPGGTPLGEKITRILKWDQKQYLSPLTETILFNASRSHLVEEVIAPALQANKIVICDRFTDSTIVYQGYAGGLDVSKVKAINNMASGGLVPDLTILLDLPAETGLARKARNKPDRFENKEIIYHSKIRDGFLKLAAGDSQRWFVIDGLKPKSEIARLIWEKISTLTLSG